jgi:hypothetical protein
VKSQRATLKTPNTAPTTSTAATSAPAATSSPTATPASSPSTSTPAPSTAPTRPATAAPARPPTTGVDEDDSALEHVAAIGVPLLGAGLLSALVLTTLRRRRRRQEHHRPVGHRVPAPANPKIETAARVVAQPLAVERLDHALRALAAALADRPAEQMPDIVGAWLDGDSVNLLLTAACPQPPAPWTGDGPTWTLPAGIDLPSVDGQLAPLPALVAVGSQPGMHLLLDLERLGLVTITGDPDRAGDLLRYIAAELSCNAWSDHVDITVAGFDAEETAGLIALGGDRIVAAPSITAAIDRVRRRAGQVIQSVEHLSAGDPLVGRIVDIAGDAWMPHILLAHNPGADDLAALQALDNDLAATGRCAVAVAATTRQDVGRWPVTIDADGCLAVGFLGLTADASTLTAARLPRGELNSLAELLDAARRGTTRRHRFGRAGRGGRRRCGRPRPG